MRDGGAEPTRAPSSVPGPSTLEERVRLMREGVVNYSGALVSGGLAVVMVPILLSGLGAAPYGLWITAWAVAGIAGLPDLGLSWSAIREIATSRQGSLPGTTLRLLESVYAAHLGIGIAGGLLVAAIGGAMSGYVESPQTRGIAPAVFALAGAAFLGDMTFSFAITVFQGLRRFDRANLLVIAGAVMRAVGFVILLHLGFGVLAIASWHASTSCAIGLAGLLLASRLMPALSLRPRLPNWRILRSHLPFSLASQTAASASTTLWGAGPILVAVLLGSSHAALYHVAQKFPLFVHALACRASEVFFPAVSESRFDPTPGGALEVLEVGTRWSVVFALPACIALWIVAPSLLAAWVGQTDAEMILVVRLTVLAVFVDTAGMAATLVLWGRGGVRLILAVRLAALALSLPLAVWLLQRIGTAGAAAALVIPQVAATLTLLRMASKRCLSAPLEVARNVVRGLGLPAAACAVVAASGIGFTESAGLATVAASVAAGALAYVLVLDLHGARDEERRLIRELLYLPLPLLAEGARRTRRILRELPLLRSGWHLLQVLVNRARRRRKAVRAQLDRDNAAGPDPWGCTTAWGRAYHESAMALIDSAGAGASFPRAIEIGCADGAFTVGLSRRCGSLLAVDISPVAIERAQSRSAEMPNVRFARWDLEKSPAPGAFDLVVAMGVLDYVNGRRRLRAARARLADLVAPDGYLFISLWRQHPVVEDASWSRWLLAGGRRRCEFVARHPDLTQISLEIGEQWVHALLQKADGAP